MAARLQGDPHKAVAPQPKTGGWHWVEWACEFGGTIFQLFLGFGAVARSLRAHWRQDDRRSPPADCGSC
jgi:hypothetical protein